MYQLNGSAIGRLTSTVEGWIFLALGLRFSAIEITGTGSGRSGVTVLVKSKA